MMRKWMLVLLLCIGGAVISMAAPEPSADGVTISLRVTEQARIL